MEPYLSFPALFTPAECATIIDIGLAKRMARATMRHEQTNALIVNENLRKCTWRVIERTELAWAYARMYSAVVEANQTFQLSIEPDFDETIKIIRYQAGEHMNHWHYDMGKNQNFDMFYRTISISLCLQEAAKGGQIQVHNPIGGEPLAIPQPVGTAVVFPSTLVHNISPIEKGQRVSFLGFVHSPKPAKKPVE